MRALFTVSISNNIFTFEQNMFIRVCGVAMGSLLGPICSNIFLSIQEEKLANNGIT